MLLLVNKISFKKKVFNINILLTNNKPTLKIKQLLKLLDKDVIVIHSRLIDLFFF